MNNSASIPNEAALYQFDRAAWHVLAARQAKIHKIHAVWHREVVFSPVRLTEEERAKHLVQVARAFPDMSPNEHEQFAKQSTDYWEHGSVGFTTLDLVRVRNVRKATVSGDGFTEIEGATHTFESRYIDFFNGSLAGRFDWSISFPNGRFDPQSQREWRGSVYSPSSPQALSMLENATLVSDRTPMDRSIPAGYDILLLQMSVSSLFSPSDADWIIQDDHCILTSHHQDDSYNRLTLSKATGCPLRLERLHPLSSKALCVYEVTQTQFVDGIEVPSEIVVYQPANGSLESYMEKYVLQSCRLNDDVADSEINLPSSTYMRDFRLGDDKEVDYTLDDGQMLSDAAVKRLYKNKQQQSHWAHAALIGLPVLGIAALGTLGVLSLKKTRL